MSQTLNDRKIEIQKLKKPTILDYFWRWNYLHKYYVYRTTIRFAWQNERFMYWKLSKRRVLLSSRVKKK